MVKYVLHSLPKWFPADGITFGKHIFMKNVANAMILEHEMVHVRQQQEHPIWFWVSYLLLLPLGWNPWRRRWEGEAYAVQAKAGCPIDGDNGLAALMSSPAYLWMCRQKAAAAEIRKWL